MPISDLDKFINKNIERGARTSMLIEEMMNDSNHRWSWAEDTLIGIYDYIQENVTATDKQKAAVENIYKHPNNINGAPF